MEGKLEEVLDEKFHVAIRYIRLLQHGYRMSDYLNKQGIEAIVVYGITDFAMAIIDEYRMSNRLNQTKAISDKKKSNGDICIYCGIPCVAPCELLNFVNKNVLVIITPMGWQREIRKNLREMGFSSVATVQELVYDMCSAVNS